MCNYYPQEVNVWSPYGLILAKDHVSFPKVYTEHMTKALGQSNTNNRGR